MLPTVDEIATKDVISIDITCSLENAIQMMAKEGHRNIVVVENIEEKHKYYFLCISDLIEYKIQNISEKTTLKELNLTKAKILKKGVNILSVLNEIDVTDKNMLVIDQKELIGIISYTDIINNIDPKILMKKQTIGNLILQYKAITTYENTSSNQVIKMMQENDTDAILITNDSLLPIGIFTTKDFIKILNLNLDLKNPIKEFMSQPVETLHNTATISDAIDFIRDKHFKRIVVTDDEDRVMGILTQKELLRIVYNKWIDFIKEEGNRISKINEQLLSNAVKLEEKASFDYLTKIYNREKFESFLNYEITIATRYTEENFCILLLDIDFFKNVNDTYGHLIGDHVLQEVAKVLTLCSRKSDVVARWGGEEFIMMLPKTNIEQAIFVAEKLRATIEKHKFEVVSHITCSIGVSQFHHSETKTELFKRVDDALYNAKKSGRNKVQLETRGDILLEE